MKTKAVQRDFSGGEISTRMLMRGDTEVYKKSLLAMENFYPTLQGSAERAPGTRFIKSLDTDHARITPFITPANERALVEFQAGVPPKIYTTLEDATGADVSTRGAQLNAITIVRRQVVENPNFKNGDEGWELFPPKYVGKKGDMNGCFWEDVGTVGVVRMIPRIYNKGDFDTCTVKNTVDITYPNNTLILSYTIAFLSAIPFNSGHVVTVDIGTTDGGKDVYTKKLEGETGRTWDISENITLPTPAWTGTLYITVTTRAVLETGAQFSNPAFTFRRFRIWASAEVDIDPEDVTGNAPYSASELKDLHFVQSAYGFPHGQKELVITHPRHPPHKLYFTNGGYIFEPIVFENPPQQWIDGNYPKTCSSFKGRLILAGSQDQPMVGTPTTSGTETVWGTEVANWTRFSDITGVNPDDSIELTTIYRSPIQWVMGQRDLLVGAVEMEYIASADGIFAPGDLGVEMHSTHGSNNVQPVGFGQTVLFPAEAGTKVRAMQKVNNDTGWVAPDVTLLTPELCASKIVRMVRMRNPHQMMVAVLGNGQLAILHQDSYANISGWSRLSLGQRIVDIAVVTNSKGVDDLYVLVRRRVAGTPTLVLEVISGWAENVGQTYMSSFVQALFDTPTNVITGLEHLEGFPVQVLTENGYLGVYTVLNGQIILESSEGTPITVLGATVGLSMPAHIKTLPAEDADEPGSRKSYTAMSVRVRASTRPLINGERPDDRSPQSTMDKSEPIELIADFQTQILGWDKYQIVTISETAPFRCEILGLYGTITGN